MHLDTSAPVEPKNESSAPIPLIGDKTSEYAEGQIARGVTTTEKMKDMAKASWSQLKFEVITREFDELVSLILEYESRNGKSTIQMFSEYIKNEEHDEETQEWFETLYLFLGTEQVRKWSCP